MRLTKMEFIKFSQINIKVTLGALFLFFLQSCGNNGAVEVGSPFSETGAYELSVERKKNGNTQAGMGDLYTKTTIKFEVNEVDGNSMTALWTYGPTKLEGTAVQITPEEQEIINIYQGMIFKLDYSAVKNRIQLKNFEEVRAQLEQLFFKVYGKDSISEGSEMYGRIKEMFKQRASSDVDLLENFFPEIPLLIGTIGQRYKHGESYSKDSIQSPYGPNFMNLVTSIEVEREEFGPVIYKVDSLRSADIDRELKSYMNTMFGDKAGEIPMGQFPRSKYQSTTIIELDEDENLRFLENEQLFSNGEEEQINSVSISVE